MNKSKMLNTYKTVNNLQTAKKTSQEEDLHAKKIYRSEYDEKLIKEYHFAKFQKNLYQIQNNRDLAALLEKDEWSEEDMKTLLAAFR